MKFVIKNKFKPTESMWDAIYPRLIDTELDILLKLPDYQEFYLWKSIQNWIDCFDLKNRNKKRLT